MKLEKLKKFAIAKGFVVKYMDFKANDGMLRGNRIGLCNNMEEEKQAFILAHEIAHGYLHKDKGDTRKSSRHKEYEEQANRTAELILDLLSMDMNDCNVGGAN